MNSVPVEILSHVMGFSGDFKLEGVCRNWQNASYYFRQEIIQDINANLNKYRYLKTLVPIFQKMHPTNSQKFIKVLCSEIIRQAKVLRRSQRKLYNYKNDNDIDKFIFSWKILNEVSRINRDLNLIKFYKKIYKEFDDSFTFDKISSRPNFARKIRRWMVRSSLMSRVSTLYLDNLKLTEIPEEIYDMKKLKHLNVIGNNIKIISDDIIKSRELGVLRLEKNRLIYISPEVGSLPHLSEITHEKNQIKLFPKSRSSPFVGLSS